MLPQTSARGNYPRKILKECLSMPLATPPFSKIFYQDLLLVVKISVPLQFVLVQDRSISVTFIISSIGSLTTSNTFLHLAIYKR
jgi:hypothetical protein